MAKQTVNIGDTGQQLVDKLGNNFTELYNDKHSHANAAILNAISETPAKQSDMIQAKSDITANASTISALQSEATAKWILLNTVDNRSRSNESRITAIEESGGGGSGVPGPPGPQGEPGPQGPQGIPGADGKSAFASAVQGGYIGTEPQFYIDLAAVGGLADAIMAIVGGTV